MKIFSLPSILTFVLGAEKNGRLKRFFCIPTPYVLVENKTSNFSLHAWFRGLLSLLKIGLCPIKTQKKDCHCSSLCNYTALSGFSLKTSMGESFQDYSWIQNFEAYFILKVSLKCRIQQIVIVSLLRFQIFWIWIFKKMLIVCTGFVRKWENRIPGLFQGFFPFSRTQFLPNFVLNNAKNALFSRKHRSEKACFLWSWFRW